MHTVKLRNLQLGSPLILAPMAGVTSMPFRLLAREMGCGLVCSEMVSAKGLVYGQEKTYSMLHIVEEERPVSIQIFGSDASVMGQAAAIVCEAGADVIDLNMGCPVPKVVKNGDGAALMRQPHKAYAVMKAVREAVDCPVTVKIRKGWSEEEETALEISKLAEAAGLDAVSFHGRTREQFYSGEADWEAIKRVADTLTLPVFGNGDVFTPEDARFLLEEVGCAAVMIGRAALGNPWIFQRTRHYLETGELLPEPSGKDRIEMALRHLQLLMELRGEKVAVREMRKHTAWYLKGLPGARLVRQQINTVETAQELQEVLGRLTVEYC